MYSRDSNAWIAEIDLTDQFPTRRVGVNGGSAGALAGSGLYCGGFPGPAPSTPSPTCLHVTRDARSLRVETTEQMPFPRAFACHSSDGTQFVIAGGVDEYDSSIGSS